MCAVSSPNRANLLLCALVIQSRLLTRTFHINDVVLYALALIGFYLRVNIRNRATANQRRIFGGTSSVWNVLGRYCNDPDVTERAKKETFASLEYRVNKALFSVELL